MSIPFSRPLADWPLILCGPILRRVTAQSVTVFVALREARTVTLRLYDSSDPLMATSLPLAEASANTVPLGTHLHVLAITVELSTSLQAGTVYGYDLAFLDSATGTSETLGDLGLLQDELMLGYWAGRLPGFSLPADPQRTKIVHGSCRKPHGHGPDALPIVDSWLENDHMDPHARPHYLLLTGDQIYADDVAVCLAKTIISTLPDLLGWEEKLAASDNSGFFTANHDSMTPELRREATVKREAKITSGHGKCQLVFLGEYYAMYLMVWSDAIWPRDENGLPSLLEYGEIEPPRVSSGSVFDALLDKDEWDENARRKAALVFARTLPRVRRVLANVPTLMIFDDHDVTDDWNLHAEWVLNVRGTRMGRRLMRNALLAYMTFQDWGNRPEAYGPGTPGATLLDSVRYTPPAVEPPLGAVTYSKFDILPAGRHPNEHNTDRVSWHYSVDLDPAGIRITVLDTRTWRHFPPSPANAPPALVTEPELSTQLPLPATAGDRLQLVVAAAPVFGVIVWEEYIQRKLVSHINPEMPDNELWGKQRQDFELLIRHLAGFGRTVLLSGDVHHAFTIGVEWFGGTPGNEDRIGRIAQLCASPTKNQGGHQLALAKIGHLPDEGDEPTEIGWLGWTDLPEPTKTFIRLAFWEDTKEGEEPKLRRMVFEEWWRTSLGEHLSAPPVLPAELWPGDTSLQALSTLPPSEWAYRVRYLTDPTDPTREEPEVVGHNNVGLVQFEGSGELQEVVHRIHRWVESDSDTVVPDQTTVRVHRASLRAPLASDRPTFPSP